VWILKTIKSWKFWLTLLLAPMLLVGCSSLFIEFDSNFVSDETISRETVQAGDISLSYIRSGDAGGQRVIFLHGTPGDAGGNWVNMLKMVPEGYEFIAVDRPGFGKTRPRDAVTSLDGQAAAIAPLLVTRGGKGTILVGHSLGGPIIAAAAATYPHKVAGIVVAAGALDPDLEEVLFIQHVGNVPPISWLLDKTLRNSNRELIALEGELRLLQPKLAHVKQPIIIVHGTADKLVPYANVAYMEREFTSSKHLAVAKLEGMNHFLQWNKNEEILEAVGKIVRLLKEPPQAAHLQTAP